MGYEQYLKALLRPLDVYDLDGECTAAELYAEGKILDDALEPAEELERECVMETAETYGLSEYEKLLPLRPVSGTTNDRRNALKSLLSIDDMSFTESILNDVISGCGIPAAVRETEDWYTAEVSFPGLKGKPRELDILRERIENILPCHLNISYRFIFLTWRELESASLTWNGIETGNMTWFDLEGCEPE